MAANWRALGDFLRDQDGPVTLSWERLAEMVGGLPASAINHRAWWSGDRPHVNAWRSAGFRVVDLQQGRSVTFVRHEEPQLLPDLRGPQPESSTEIAGRAPEPSPSVLLVTCVKSKRSTPSAAKDLYTSPLFLNQRAYAEASGRPWFILSAEHGVVEPDEWLAPYERYLPDTSRSYREAWGRWVVARLELLLGPLAGTSVEVHASDAYLKAIVAPMRAAGADLVAPLTGLSLGQRLQWYAAQLSSTGRATTDDVVVSRHPSRDDVEFLADEIAALISDEAAAITVPRLLGSDRKPLQRPGLYSWWVDHPGAEDLTHALGEPLQSGLIYAGQAGATRWPSGRRSSNTLWSRLAGMHLGRKHEFSTFRRTLAALLAPVDSQGGVDEAALTAWMTEHLRVIPAPIDNADILGAVELEVLGRLDPPLNLKGMPDSTVRDRLKEARRPLARKASRRGAD